jgi:hypothetical protein
VGLKRRTSDGIARNLQLMAETFGNRLSDTYRLVSNFRSNTVAWKNGKLQQHVEASMFRIARSRVTANALRVEGLSQIAVWKNVWHEQISPTFSHGEDYFNTYTPHR